MSIGAGVWVNGWREILIKKLSKDVYWRGYVVEWIERNYNNQLVSPALGARSKSSTSAQNWQKYLSYLSDVYKSTII